MTNTKSVRKKLPSPEIGKGGTLLHKCNSPKPVNVFKKDSFKKKANIVSAKKPTNSSSQCVSKLVPIHYHNPLKKLSNNVPGKGTSEKEEHLNRTLIQGKINKLRLNKGTIKDEEPRGKSTIRSVPQRASSGEPLKKKSNMTEQHKLPNEGRMKSPGSKFEQSLQGIFSPRETKVTSPSSISKCKFLYIILIVENYKEITGKIKNLPVSEPVSLTSLQGDDDSGLNTNKMMVKSLNDYENESALKKRQNQIEDARISLIEWIKECNNCFLLIYM
jgi:hypothetical protein